MSAIMAEADHAPDESPFGVILYLTVSFGVSWAVWIGCWLATRRGVSGETLIPTVIAGSFAPLAASGLAVWARRGARAALGFYRRGLEWRMGWIVFLVSVLALPLIGVAVAAIAAGAAGHALVFQMSWRDAPYDYCGC